MNITVFNLIYAIILVLIVVVITIILEQKIAKNIIVGTIRTIIQLSLLGYFLNYIFQYNNPATVILYSLFMITVAAWTAYKRVKHRKKYILSYSFISFFLAVLVTGGYLLFLTIPQTPWYNTYTVIPLIGMLLGNSLTGVTLSINSLTQSLRDNRSKIEQSLALGATRYEAVKSSFTTATQAGLNHILNMMMAVGLISIPGMMTGQILGGGDAWIAAKYQIQIMLMIFCCTFFATTSVLTLTYFKMLNSDHQFADEEI